MSGSPRIRVALFFDGKNHMKDFGRTDDRRWLDHGALAAWVVQRVGGTELASAHYYTGVPSATDEPSPRRALADMLRDLENLDGFFVHRFQRQVTTWNCSSCGHAEVFTREKQVDTSLVADIVLMAARGAFDVAVVFSGDQDLTPAIDAVHALGAKAWVATFGRTGMSKVLGRAAWAVIDLAEHLDAFAHPDITGATVVSDDPVVADAEVLRELRRAEAHFGAAGGFVGGHYFLHRWRGQGVPESPNDRRAAVERLISAGLVEMYEVDGKQALRATGSEPADEAMLGEE